MGGSSKKPPGKGADPPTLNDVLHPHAIDQLQPDTKKDVEARSIVEEDGRAKLAVIDIEATPMKRAYDLVEAILAERSRNIFSALIRNIGRKSWAERAYDRAAGISTAGIGVLTGEWVIIAGGALIAVARDILDTLRIRRKRNASSKERVVEEARRLMLFTAASIKGVGGDDQPLRQLPDLPEFQNAWIRSSWRLCHFIRHYNVRAVTINELLGDATMGEEEVKAAKRMAALLDRERPRLLRIKRALQDLHGEKSVAFRDLACHNQRLARDDLFGDHKRSFAPVEWLTLPYGKLLKVEVVQQLRDDLDVIANVKEVDVTVLDKRFAELERAERARLAKEREAEEKAAREKEAAAKEGKEEAKGPEST